MGTKVYWFWWHILTWNSPCHELSLHPLPSFKQGATNYCYCSYILDDNKVYSWGNSNSGQLGTGDIETCAHPRLVHLGVSLGTKLKGITCGTRHSFVWTQDGDCFSFGNNYSGQLGYDFRKPDFKENQVLSFLLSNSILLTTDSIITTYIMHRTHVCDLGICLEKISIWQTVKH